MDRVKIYEDHAGKGWSWVRITDLGEVVARSDHFFPSWSAAIDSLLAFNLKPFTIYIDTYNSDGVDP